MVSMLNQIILVVLDHVVACLNHVDVSRNFNQAIKSLLEVHRKGNVPISSVFNLSVTLYHIYLLILFLYLCDN